MGIGVENDEIGPCRNAEEYAIEWLEKHGGPVSPSELAEEYDCTPGHMQDALRDSDEVTRVEIGKYVLATEINNQSTDTEDPVESADMALFGYGNEDTENDGEHGDDVPVGRTGEFSMDSQDVIQQQRELATETEEDAEEIEDGPEEIEEESAGGIPSPVSPPILIAGVVAVVVVIAWLQFRRSGGSTSPNQNEQRREDSPFIGG